MLTMRLTAVVLGLLLGTCVWGAESQAPRPNIIILFADDLGYGDLSSYGHPYIRTPNLDELADEGQRWTDFYVAAPVCSPSRGALLTGRLPVRTGLYGRQLAVLFPDDKVGIPQDQQTVAEALKDLGYATAAIGKWHLGDSPEAYPTRHGFDYWFGLPYSNDMNWVGELSFGELIELAALGKNNEVQASLAGRQAKYLKPKADYWDLPLIRSEAKSHGFEERVVARPLDQTRLTQSFTEEAVRFIERHRQQPFFLYLPYTAPHTPLFRGRKPASPAGLYGDVVEEIDWSVGEIVSALQDHDLERNTLVVFTSDNGPWLTMNTHGGTAGILKHGKGTTYEGGMRVPAVFWWPGRVQSAVIRDIGSTLDLFETVLALAGADPETAVATDGYDLSDTLTRQRPSPRNSLAYYRSGELRAFRKGSFKLHLITEGAYGQPPDRQEWKKPLLYNLRTDPAERFDVADQHPDVVEDILAAIAEHQTAMQIRPPLFDQRLQVNQQQSN